MSPDRQRFAMHAAVFAALAHPARLEIVQLLCEGEHTPAELAAAIRVSKPNLSQHLTMLQRDGLIGRRRDGAHVIYRVVDPRLAEVCTLIDEIMNRELNGRVRALETEVRTA